MFTEANQAYFNPGYTSSEEPINFKLRLASLSFLPFCCFICSYSLNSENVHVNLYDHVFKVILESNSECSVNLSKGFFAFFAAS